MSGDHDDLQTDLREESGTKKNESGGGINKGYLFGFLFTIGLGAF